MRGRESASFFYSLKSIGTFQLERRALLLLECPLRSAPDSSALDPNSESRSLPINVSALSDARCGGGVNAGRGLRARSIKPFERSRPWLRRTRALCKFNCGKERCEGAPELCESVQHMTPCAEQLDAAKKYCKKSG